MDVVGRLAELEVDVGRAPLDDLLSADEIDGLVASEGEHPRSQGRPASGRSGPGRARRPSSESWTTSSAEAFAAGNAQRDGVHRPAVALCQRLECVVVAGRDPRGQPCVLHGTLGFVGGEWPDGTGVYERDGIRSAVRPAPYSGHLSRLRWLVPGGLMASAAQRTCFQIADISGYTGYLADVEPDHAQEILADLIGAVVTALWPNFRLAKLEGDTAFTFMTAEKLDGSMPLDTIERCYFGFRRCRRDVRRPRRASATHPPASRTSA